MLSAAWVGVRTDGVVERSFQSCRVSFSTSSSGLHLKNKKAGLYQPHTVQPKRSTQSAAQPVAGSTITSKSNSRGKQCACRSHSLRFQGSTVCTATGGQSPSGCAPSQHPPGTCSASCPSPHMQMEEHLVARACKDSPQLSKCSSGGSAELPQG